MDKKCKNIIYIILRLFLCGCSTKKRWPEGEVLYIGVKDIQMIEPDNEKVSTELESQVTSAVSAAPNNAFFGSAKLRIPFPMGLWIYNAFKTDKEKGFKSWIFNRFAAEPVLLSTVDQKLRAKLTETLREYYAYFIVPVAYT